MSAKTLALYGGTPVGSPTAPPYPRFTCDAIDRVTQLLERGDAVGLGRSNSVIREAEEGIAKWQGVAHCLGTTSGHAALHAALIGLEITGGDEVITTPYTWGASVSCILHNGAVPVFADVHRETGLLDPESVESQITTRTRAILAVHIFGQAADMTTLRRIADERGLALIEDGSQAHGAIHAGRKVGQFGDASGFSCMGGKLLATTEAGYMVTPREDVYWKAALGCQHNGRSGDDGFPSDLRPYVDSLVYTYRLSTVNAILLSEQIKKVDAEIDGRRRNAAAFRAAMDGVSSVRLPDYAPADDPSYHMLTMTFAPERAGITRDTYAEALRAEGVGTFGYVPAPISQWRRLDPTCDMPRTLWQDVIRRSGRSYAEVPVPNCEWRIAHALELGWNYVTPDADGMSQLADAFHKIEQNLDVLRDREAAEMPKSG